MKIQSLLSIHKVGIRKWQIWIALAVFVCNSVLMPMALAETANGPKLPVGERLASPPPPAMPARINKGPKSVKLFQPKLTFSTNPKDVEISSAHILPEPLIPIKGTSNQTENKALAAALRAFKNRKNLENISALKKFITTYPNSRWVASLELNLGLLRFQYGYLSEALKYWQSAWEKTKDLKSPDEKAIADGAASNLALLQARIGRKNELQEFLAEVDKRGTHGTAELKIRQAHQGLSCMEHHPDIAYKCGPFALSSILQLNKSASRHQPIIEKTASTDKGTNLAMLKELADQLGLKYQMAKRTKGSQFIVPSIIHWKLGHFAAIVAQKGGRYRVKDPTFGASNNNLWISSNALESETDGYFLIPAGTLPVGWHTVTIEQAKKVWGKGAAGGNDQGKTSSYPKTCSGTGCGCNGMAQASVFTSEATLNISDIPLAYKPPVGPGIDFMVNYNYLEGNQPGTFTFTNLGADWSLNWVSYLTLDSSQNATVSVRGGGFEQYNYVEPNNVTNPYAPNLMSQAVLSIPQAGTYYRNLPDGSIEVFNQPDSTGRIFMTQVIDPQGNSAYVQYDGNFRVTTVTDAIGQASTITYLSNTLGNAGFYKVSTITDPFGRSTTFTYDSTDTYLFSITDVIGLVSAFTYDISSSFIATMTTPYGTTGFYQYTVATDFSSNALKFTFPDATTSVIENWVGDICNTYFWDREATALYPYDPANHIYTHCQTTHWQLLGDVLPSVQSGVANSFTPPLENTTTYTYAGQSSTGGFPVVGTSNKPIQITRTIGSNTQTYQYQYNSLGYATQSIDPVSRTFTYSYAANNIDLLEKRQTRSTNNDLIGKWIYNNTQHLPNTYIDGSGQKTQYAYNSFGELTTLTDANSNVWTNTYNGNGYLTQIQGPLAGSNDITTFTYDGYGRLYTVTDSEGYTLTYSYDNANRLTQITYPDGTYEQIVYSKLDAIMTKDRIGRWTQRSYDSMDQLAFEIDPLSRKTEYDWCDCGSLAALTDPAGHTTNWAHDLEGRLITKTYPDSTTLTYTYDAIGRLSTRTDALSQVTTYTYNLDNTLSQTAYTNTVNPTSTVNLTYDPNYLRMSTVQNGWGTITDSYNAYITDPYATPITGGGRLGSVANNVISNSTATYTYDALGRTTNRSINSSSNSTTWTYDAMSRITNETNPLGSFGYTYVDDTSGSSKGTLRLASISYPNSQTTNFSWYGNTGDQRLQQISNLNPSSVTLSQFNYAYDPAGEITQWQQQQNGSNIYNNLTYDLAGQLSSVQGNFGSSPPPYANQYYYNYDAASNRTAVQKTLSQTARIGGTKTTGDIITITVSDPNLSGGQEAVTYTVQSGDTLTTIASGLAAAITADANLQTLGVNAISTGPLVTIQSASKSITTYASSLSGGATETVTLGALLNGTENALIGGTKTTSDALTITVHDAGLSGGQESVTYTVLSGDTLTTIASGLAAAINADTNLQSIGVSAISASTVVSVKSISTNATTYTESTSIGATETITLSTNTNGIQTATVGGSKTTGNTLTITAYDSGLSSGSEAVTYTVLSGDTLTSIASGIASAINADTNLQAIGVSASSVSTVVNLKSVSLNNTTYVESTSGGATETITLGLSTGIQQYTYNNVNELTGIAAGGLARFQGTTNKAVKSATINGTIPATLNWSQNFTGNAALSTGVNNTTVSAVDGGNNTVTNHYNVSVNTSSSQSLTYDSNGNMTSDGTNTYAWDAENRLIKVTYPGSGNNSAITYDALGNKVKIVETRAGSVTSTKQFVNAGSTMCEARDASSSIISQYFPLGQTLSGANYYYAPDHLGSVCVVTDSSGNVVAQYHYGPYGEVTKIQGTFDSNFQYAGYYYHAPSGLNLTLNRAYNANLGRWINRDPIGEAGGVNLYGYVDNNPISHTDPSGLAAITCPKFKLPKPTQLYGPPRLYSKPAVGLPFQHTSIFVPPLGDLGPSGTFLPIDISAGPNGVPWLLTPYPQNDPAFPDYKAQTDINRYVPLPHPPGVSQEDWINDLRNAAQLYRNRVGYDPSGGLLGSYNSNSYTSGVINKAAGSEGISDYSVTPPGGLFLTPGFSNPLP